MLTKISYLLLRLFILRIGKDKSKAIYRIAYGVITPNVNVMSEPNISEFSEMLSCGGKKFYTGIVTMACEREKIIGVYEDLSRGAFLKDSFAKWGISTNGMKYDVRYDADSTMVPWNVENIIESQLTYSKYICMLEPQCLFEIERRLPDAEDVSKALDALGNYLTRKTSLPFNKSYDHIGNLEILISPDRDVHGKPLIECCLEKEEPYMQNIKIAFALSDSFDLVTVNMRLVVDGITKFDTILSKKPESGKDVNFSIPSDKQVSTSEIKVWLTKDEETKLVHHAVYHVIKRFQLSINIVSDSILADSEWLQKIRGLVPKAKKGIIKKASLIEHTSKEKHEIHDNEYPKWGNRKPVIKPIEKCNDAFFPKGWDKETDEIGALSFLEWFKQKANGAASVFLQDPYFEDVALYFLASSDIECEYTILTQTSLRTNPDNTSYSANDGLRKDKIVSCIRNFPLLFSPLKLVVKDMLGVSPKLHDRFLIIVYPNNKCEGYSLSNSLQGATMKQPLLITQIGKPVLNKVKKHITELIDENDTKTIYDYRESSSKDITECHVIADSGFHSWLQKHKYSAMRGDIKHILDDMLYWQTVKKISTVGYCLANIPDDRSYCIIKEAESIIARDNRWTEVLKDYILDKHYSDFPIGFIGCPYRGHNQYNTSVLLDLCYEKIVSNNNIQLIEYSCYESNNYGVWGQYYACQVLVNVSHQTAIDVLKLLRPTLTNIKTDKTITPVYKITNMLMSAMFESVISSKDNTLMEAMLTDSEDWCRGLGSIILIHKAKEKDFDTAADIRLITSEEECIVLCNVALASKPEVANKKIFYDCLINDFTQRKDVDFATKNLVNILKESRSLEEKKEYINNVYRPLISTGLLSKDELCCTLIDGLFDASVAPDTCLKQQGVLPMAVHCIDGAIESMIANVTKIIQKTNAHLQSISIKNDDNISMASHELTNLRNLLLSMIEMYNNDVTNNSISKIIEIIKDVDALLDSVGLEKTKRQFEYK